MHLATKFKPVQSRIPECPRAIGWPNVSRVEAEQRRGFSADISPANCAKNRAFLHELMTAKTRVHELEITE